MPASLSLFVISILAGIALLWIFARTSNQAAIRATKKRLQARLLELRLYADDPSVVLGAQKALLIENARYFCLMLRPALFATIPMVALLIVMDGFFGYRPIAPGRAAIVTAALTDASQPVTLRAPDGIRVETPAAAAVSVGQVSWRIRPERAVTGEIEIDAGSETVTKKVAAGEGVRYLTPRRARSLWLWSLSPGEKRLGAGPVEWIEVEYPSGEVAYFGLKAHWLMWFLIFSMGSAFLLKGRFRVTV